MNTNILFPAKLRYIAYGILIFLIAFIFIAGSLNLLEQKPEIKILAKNILIALICLSLFLIQFTRYTDDDEMLMEIRLKLVLNALLVGTIYLIISPLVDYYIFSDDVQEIKAGQIIMFMLLYQIFMFQLKRFSLRKELKENEELH